MTGARELIVNVDDLGLHPAVRRAVERCAERGSVTSASMLANGPDRAALRDHPGVSIGAHLNILRGEPLSPAREVRSLVDGRGRFFGSWTALALRAAAGALDLDEVRLEWSRQVEALLERGVTLTHLDAEKHTHCLPRLFAVACAVAETHGIRFVRRSDERFGGPARGAGLARRLTLRALCALARKSSGVRTTDGAWGIAAQGRHLSAAACMRALAHAPPGVIEVVCHPGDRAPGDPELPASFGRMRVHELWQPELESLLHQPWRELAEAHGWKLVGFDRAS